MFMVNYILIVNWNGWKDTVECLESVCRLQGCEFRVVVCDNGSEDKSIDRIKGWARGDLRAECANRALSSLVEPPVLKPVTIREISREDLASGSAPGDEQITVIRVGRNRGYAGGNNIGLLYALRDPEARYLWILNNDTVVDPQALSAMVKRMDSHRDIGLCGSLNLAYYDPTEVQARGGRRYGRWTGRPFVCSPKVNASRDDSEEMDYIIGASMLVRREFVEQIGFLDESYFIYFEELDWAERAKGKYSLGYAHESVIYHKEGAAIGTNANRRLRSLTSERYQARNRVLFAKRYCPWTLPTVLLTVCATAAHRYLIGSPRNAREILAWAMKGMLAGKASQFAL